MEQVIYWLIDNIAGAIISAIVGAIFGMGVTKSYYSHIKKQSQKSGRDSQNIQVNGNFTANNINN